MKTLFAIVLVAACGGGTPAPAAPLPPSNSGGLVIVDDIDCGKLVNHMVDVHVAATPEKSAGNADEVQQIRDDMVKKCEDRWSATPPTETEKTSARCSMKAKTPDELQTCGS